MKKLYLINGQNGYYKFLFEHYAVPDNVEVVRCDWQHPHGFLKKLVHKLMISHLPKKILPFLYPSFPFDKIRTIERGSSVLTFDIINPNTLLMLRRVIPSGVHYFNHLLNPIKNNAPLLQNASLIADLKNRGINLSTFDRADAETYQIPFKQQFYCKISQEELTAEVKYDFFFCGLPKDRSEDIIVLTDNLQRMGYNCKVIIPQNQSQRISTDQYIRLLKQSGCVIDINQQGQMGLSRRPLEALFFKKKLITNNAAVLSCDFYHPNNVFFLKDGRLDGIRDFLDKPMKIVPASVVEEYTIDNWLQQFIDESL